LTIFVFFWYIYSDELLAIWDRRVGGAEAVEKNLAKLEICPARVKQELQVLAAVLHLPLLNLDNGAITQPQQWARKKLNNDSN
jgi:inhibitor of Bruton tyrosine kinase